MTSADWVKFCPYLNVDVPKPLAPDTDEIKTVKDIYEFYKDMNPANPFKEFIKHYTKLPNRPSLNQSKLDQVVVAVGLMKLARKTKGELMNLGIKI